MGVGSTNNRVCCTTKANGRIFEGLVMICYAFLGLWSNLESVVMKKAIGRVLENLIRLLYDNRASRMRKLMDVNAILR